MSYFVRIAIMDGRGGKGVFEKEYVAPSPDDVCDLVEEDMQSMGAAGTFRIEKIVPAEEPGNACLRT